MRLFLSWSGEASRQAAVALRDWLPLVLQAVEPYMSAEDLEKGVRWSTEIGTELDSCNFGIICLTPENLEAPWIQFEAGALSKSVETSRVSPLLIGLKPSDVTGPLVQFQAASPDRADMLRLVHAINIGCGDNGLQKERVERVFEALWPQLESQLQEAVALAEQGGRASPKRAVPDMLEELLELTRNQTRLLARVATSESEARVVEEESGRRIEARRRRALARHLLGLDERTRLHVSDDRLSIFLPGDDSVKLDPTRLAKLTSRPEFQGIAIDVIQHPGS